jgi:hypothetical protein
MSIAEILQSGAALLLDLLEELPDSSEPISWKRVPLQSPVALTAIPLVVSKSPLLLVTIEVPFVPVVATPTVVNAFGARFQGQTVFVGYCSAFYLASDFPIVFRASIIIYPWAS